MEFKIDINEVEMQAEVVSNIISEHTSSGNHFFDLYISIPRLSGVKDIIPTTIPKNLIDKEDLTVGAQFYFLGEIRSRNVFEDGRSKLKLYFFVKKLSRDLKEGYGTLNKVKLTGYVCKKYEPRQTPSGTEIADMIIAVNRSGRCAYIPCVLWNDNAKFSQNINVGDCVQLFGRFQSRDYEKKLSETETMACRAYELSVGKISLLNTKE